MQFDVPLHDHLPLFRVVVKQRRGTYSTLFIGPDVCTHLGIHMYCCNA